MPLNRSFYNKLHSKSIVILLFLSALFGIIILLLIGSNLKNVFVPSNTNPSLVYAIFHEQFDEIYLSSPGKTNQPQLLTQIDRFTSHSVTPANGVFKNKIAYIAIPTKSKELTKLGTLWTINLSTGQRTVLATDADPTNPPQWLDGGETLLYKRIKINQQELITIDLKSRIKTIVFSESFGMPDDDNRFGGIYPVGQDASNNIIFAKLTTSGTDILVVSRISGHTLKLFRASNEFARDFSLSPDKTQLSYLLAVDNFERINYQTAIYDLSHENLLTYTSDSREQFSPRWIPNTDLLSIGQIDAKKQSGAIILLSETSSATLPPPAQGFDVPISWSASGRFLSIKNYSGISGLYPGTSSLLIIDRSLETRTLLESESEATVFGWWSND